MKPDYVDFHAHLDLYPDLRSAIEVCNRRRTATFAVTTTPKAYSRNCELAEASEFVRVGLGLHPQLVEDRAGEIELFERLLPQSRYVGEVGLDSGPRHYQSLDLQKSIFKQILQLCADQGGKIISVHSVRAAKLVLDMVDEHLPRDRGTVVLHWFTGSAKEARRGVELGCYFSMNEQMLASPTGQRVLKSVPADRVLTETDGPFVKRHGRPIGAGDVQGALKAIAKAKNEKFSHVQDQILRNLSALASDASFSPIQVF
jgi:TatD DNase family protein